MEGLFQCPPWARSFCPFRACGAHLRNLSKVKKCLLKSGKVSSSDDPSMPFGWSACARYTGIRSPPSGHRQPLCWATTAHNAGNECPNIGLIFGQYSFDSLRYLVCPRRPRRVCHGLMTHPLFIFTQLLDDFLKLLNIQ